MCSVLAKPAWSKYRSQRPSSGGYIKEPFITRILTISLSPVSFKQENAKCDNLGMKTNKGYINHVWPTLQPTVLSVSIRALTKIASIHEVIVFGMMGYIEYIYCNPSRTRVKKYILGM